VIDLTAVARFGLLLVRPGMIVMIAPAFGGNYTPAQVKIALVFFFAIGLLPSVQLPAAGSDAGLVLTIAREAAIGLALALVTRSLIIAAEFAGHLSGYQIGFSYNATVDPSSGARHNMLATLYGMVAVIAFLGVDGHHVLLRALADSYTGLPIGAGHVNESILQSVTQILALVFTIGVRLAAPIVIVLLVVELAIGLISRTAPSLSFQTVGYPVRIVIGLALLGTVLLAVMRVTGGAVPRVVSLALEVAGAFK
jgi:flagellar biosynthetic protein FliR